MTYNNVSPTSFDDVPPSSQGSTGSISQINTASGQLTSTGGNTPTIGLATTGVVPGNYTNPNLDVDAYGRLILVSQGSGTGGVTGIYPNGDTSSLGMGLGTCLSQTVTGAENCGYNGSDGTIIVEGM